MSTVTMFVTAKESHTTYTHEKCVETKTRNTCSAEFIVKYSSSSHPLLREKQTLTVTSHRAEASLSLSPLLHPPCTVLTHIPFSLSLH
jgi:hypothetical protein